MRLDKRRTAKSVSLIVATQLLIIQTCRMRKRETPLTEDSFRKFVCCYVIVWLIYNTTFGIFCQ